MRFFLWSMLVLMFLSGCSGFFSQEQMVAQPERVGALKEGVLLYLNQQIKDEPDNPKWYLEKALYYEQTGWPSDALEALNKVMALDTGSLEAYTLRLRYHINKKNYEAALQDADYLLKKASYSEELVNNRLTALYGQGRLEEFHEEVLGFTGSLSPLNTGLLSKYYLNRGDSLLAIRYAYLNYQNTQLSDEALLDLVNLLSKKGFTDKALTILEGVSTVTQGSQIALATLLMGDEKVEEGVEILNALVVQGSQKALLQLSRHYESQNQLDEAIGIYNTFLQQNDSSVQVLNQLGQLYQQRYFWSSALRVYQQVLKKAPNNEEAIQESQKVSGKIAYLRSLKTQQGSEPTNN